MSTITCTLSRQKLQGHHEETELPWDIHKVFTSPHGRCTCTIQHWQSSHFRNLYKTSEGVPHSSVGKESTCHAGDSSSIPGSVISPGEAIGYPLQYSWASLVAQLEKNLPAMWETWVQSLGWEDPLEKGKATHSCILAWRIPWNPGGEFCSPWGCKESDTTERLSLHLTYSVQGTFVIPFRNGMNIFKNYAAYDASPASLFRRWHWGLQRMRPIGELVSNT